MTAFQKKKKDLANSVKRLTWLPYQNQYTYILTMHSTNISRQFLYSV